MGQQRGGMMMGRGGPPGMRGPPPGMGKIFLKTKSALIFKPFAYETFYISEQNKIIEPAHEILVLITQVTSEGSGSHT